MRPLPDRGEAGAKNYPPPSVLDNEPTSSFLFTRGGICVRGDLLRLPVVSLPWKACRPSKAFFATTHGSFSRRVSISGCQTNLPIALSASVRRRRMLQRSLLRRDPFFLVCSASVGGSDDAPLLSFLHLRDEIGRKSRARAEQRQHLCVTLTCMTSESDALHFTKGLQQSLGKEQQIDRPMRAISDKPNCPSLGECERGCARKVLSVCQLAYSFS